jgi:hypothetical protein
MTQPMLPSLILFMILMPLTSNSLWFDIEASMFKCFSEELPENYFVTGHYEALPGYSQLIDVKVVDPSGNTVHEDKGIDKGKVTLTTKTAGDYQICFYNRVITGIRLSPGMKRRIKFDLSTGQEAVDYSRVARKEHLKPVEINLRIMEDTVKQIHTEYHYFKGREAEMRNTNESNNSRAMWITICNVAIFITFAGWQVFHLKRFFISKKLING